MPSSSKGMYGLKPAKQQFGNPQSNYAPRQGYPKNSQRYSLQSKDDYFI
eukprot:CAMPEP_0114589468 /NCGR_PEP_ID=MMETSP0125-20121206/11907_1 /TAXON_ID=485358 ORGANISM="Aristerostoma sp., Strain ATCC 50986" /NCGR_SAMPLE_ID=MMETSP0125 /ASSEMBLY_ACC=CAM_ASM_000245 /LENGTH=48 /DNA_ID= /DNA_START= /DNA_END= /DNA_ORIENTATION=